MPSPSCTLSISPTPPPRESQKRRPDKRPPGWLDLEHPASGSTLALTDQNGVDRSIHVRGANTYALVVTANFRREWTTVRSPVLRSPCRLPSCSDGPIPSCPMLKSGSFSSTVRDFTSSPLLIKPPQLQTLPLFGSSSEPCTCCSHPCRTPALVLHWGVCNQAPWMGLSVPGRYAVQRMCICTSMIPARVATKDASYVRPSGDNGRRQPLAPHCYPPGSGTVQTNPSARAPGWDSDE